MRIPGDKEGTQDKTGLEINGGRMFAQDGRAVKPGGLIQSRFSGQ
jgi:hypothetical protein